jgi:hypothetical protein
LTGYHLAMDRAPPRRVELMRHPGTASAGVVRRIDVEISSTPDGNLRLRYFVDGNVSRMVVPPPVRSRQADGLWRHTCFEAFVAGQSSTAYCEFNFSPSTEWAVYGFTSYREGIAQLEHATPPLVATSITDDRIALEAVVPRETLLALPGDSMLRLGLAAVIERVDGGCSYWALTHPGERPDFHDPDGFVLRIERNHAW